MNAVVETINAAGRAFVDFALPMLVQSTVLILILLVVDVLLRKRVRAIFRYWIWMLVLIKLVLPPSLWSPVSVGRWFGDELQVSADALLEDDQPVAAEPPSTAVQILSQPAPLWIEPMGDVSWRAAMAEPSVFPAAPGDDGVIEPDTAGASVEADQPRVAPAAPITALDWRGFALLAWAGVVVALLLLLLQRAVFVRGLVAQAAEASASMQNVLDECRARVGLGRAVALKISPNATSPAVCGLVRPVILIPRNLAPKISRHDLHAVLLHELAHVKRGDLWISLAQTLLQIVYFYNPLLWLANAVIRRVREQAVDEAVLVAMGESAPDYPETLVNVAKIAFKRRPVLSLRLIGVVESKSALTARIKHILNRPFPKTARLGILGVLVVAIIAAVMLPMAKARPLTDRAGKVMELAEEEARAVNHNYVGTEHILVALARDSEAVSAQVLASFDVDVDTLRTEMAKLVKPGSDPPRKRRLPRTLRAKRVMKYAKEEARTLGHDYLGTEHILLGVMCESQGVGAQMLENLGLAPQQVKAEVFRFVQSAREPGVEVESPIEEEASPESPGREFPSPPIFGHDVRLNFADPTVRDGSFHSDQSVAFVMGFHGIGDLKPGVLLSGVLIGQTNRSFILEGDRIAIQDGSVGREIGSETWPVAQRQFDKVVTLPVTYGQKQYSCPIHVEMDRDEDGSLTGSYWFCAYLSGRLPWGAGGRSFEIVNLDQQRWQRKDRSFGYRRRATQSLRALPNRLQNLSCDRGRSLSVPRGVSRSRCGAHVGFRPAGDQGRECYAYRAHRTTGHGRRWAARFPGTAQVPHRSGQER